MVIFIIVKLRYDSGLQIMNTKLIITSSVIATFAFLIYLANSPVGAGTLLGYLALASVAATGGLEYSPQRRHTVKK